MNKYSNLEVSDLVVRNFVPAVLNSIARIAVLVVLVLVVVVPVTRYTP